MLEHLDCLVRLNTLHPFLLLEVESGHKTNYSYTRSTDRKSQQKCTVKFMAVTVHFEVKEGYFFGIVNFLWYLEFHTFSYMGKLVHGI